MPFTTAYQEVKDGVVRVLALLGREPITFGSGSIIGSGATVLTCAHCIEPNCAVAIVDPNFPNRNIIGKVVYSEPKADIALLQFQQQVGKPVKFANSNGCRVGNGAFVVGYPMGIAEQTLFSAHIASITENGLRIDASVNHGNSGGPLFNLNAEQIGVVNAKHGSLSQFLTVIKNAQPTVMISVGDINPIEAIQRLIDEMQTNLNLGIGYAIPTTTIKPLHPILTECIP